MSELKYKTPAAEKWFAKANEYKPKQGRDYKWVWEYAKFRLGWATDRIQYTEEKALELLKLIIASGAVALGALTVLHIDPLLITDKTVLYLSGVSFLSFLGAVAFALLAYLPTIRLLPVAEDAALRCADKYESNDEAMAKFAQVLSSSVEHETDIASDRGKKIKVSVCLMSVAVIVFLIAISLAVHQSASLPSHPQPQTDFHSLGNH